MNGPEQKAHRSVTQKLESTLAETAEATVERFEKLERTIASHYEEFQRLQKEHGEFRTYVIGPLAERQRDYVDRADKLTDAKVDTFIRRGFWARWDWLFRGLR